MRIITAGGSYADIDVYGGIIAYAELLQKQGIEAKAVTTGSLNESIPPIVRSWEAPISYTYTPNGSDTFTLIDISEPEYFEDFVDVNRIDEIIDHHPGLEEYWHERIGDRARIERVGAACTQVVEKWQQAGLLNQMSQTSARLLMCGILDNTLNFGADITTERDHTAYTALQPLADLPEDWPSQYFRDCQTTILQDLTRAITNDTKTPQYKTYPHRAAVGQLAFWDGAAIAQESEATFANVATTFEPHWFMNVISIGEGKSYLISDVPEVQNWLHEVLGVTFDGTIAVADRMWLRKEILKADIDHSTAISQK